MLFVFIAYFVLNTVSTTRSLSLQLIQPGFLEALSHKGYDEKDEDVINGDDEDDGWQDAEEKNLPEFVAGEHFQLNNGLVGISPTVRFH